jgi:hypothetical protein
MKFSSLTKAKVVSILFCHFEVESFGLILLRNNLVKKNNEKIEAYLTIAEDGTLRPSSHSASSISTEMF